MSPVPSPGRGEKVRTAVLAATLDELGAHGYAALTVDNVARRAGVHKTTVYRRWPDRDGLIADALSDSVDSEISIPDTGSIETDLRALARTLVVWIDSPSGRAILAAALSDAVGLPRPPDSIRHVFRDRIRRALPIVDKAMDRGELPRGTDPARMLKTLAAPIYMRALITHEPLDEAAADAAARLALTAARAGLFGGDPEPGVASGA
ncbi:TetR/AcrR family transcriptional regulator [Nocardia jejuensis]|uniref:TetR/AcrR family transcriptional regulator n=1 Tax=Nocardia jejuensis TaxID=328049 RepID=UPI000ACF16DA|nr:TetR/AcrR family transcriptional regulator [Nocardia jejuensis]